MNRDKVFKACDDLFFIMKLVVLVRMDLKMPKGKLAVQCSHASVDCVLNSDKRKVALWCDESAKKVVLKVKNLAELKRFKRLTDKEGLVNSVIKDAGKTVFGKSTVTCLGIGPDSESKIDKITKDLKML